MALKALTQLMEGPLALMSDLWLWFLMELQIHHHPCDWTVNSWIYEEVSPHQRAKRLPDAPTRRGRCSLLIPKLRHRGTVSKQKRHRGAMRYKEERLCRRNTHTPLSSVSFSSNLQFLDWTQTHCSHYCLSISHKASCDIICCKTEKIKEGSKMQIQL